MESAVHTAWFPFLTNADRRYPLPPCSHPFTDHMRSCDSLRPGIDQRKQTTLGLMRALRIGRLREPCGTSSVKVTSAMSNQTLMLSKSVRVCILDSCFLPCPCHRLRASVVRRLVVLSGVLLRFETVKTMSNRTRPHAAALGPDSTGCATNVVDNVCVLHKQGSIDRPSSIRRAVRVVTGKLEGAEGWNGYGNSMIVASFDNPSGSTGQRV